MASFSLLSYMLLHTAARCSMLGLPALTELCALEPKRSHTQPKTPSNDNRDADEGSDVHFITDVSLGKYYKSWNTISSH